MTDGRTTIRLQDYRDRSRRLVYTSTGVLSGGAVETLGHVRLPECLPCPGPVRFPPLLTAQRAASGVSSLNKPYVNAFSAVLPTDDHIDEPTSRSIKD